MKLEARDLKRHFGQVKAVDGLSFVLEPGSIYGFVGPNGAGKTTTLRMLATLDEPTEGDILLDGVSVVDHPEAARRVIGFMPDGLPTHGDVTCHEYLDVFARAYGLRGAARRRLLSEIEEFTGLVRLAERPIAKLSKGQKQRLSLARALVHDPAVLLLDEPAAGLDPRARVELRELLRALAEQGKAILISSHILTELSEICHGALIIDHGRRVRFGSIDQLLEQTILHRSVRLRTLDDGETLSRRLLATAGVEAVRRVAREIEIDVLGGDAEVADLLARLVGEGLRIVEWRQIRSGLEDVFLSMTGREDGL